MTSGTRARTVEGHHTLMDFLDRCIGLLVFPLVFSHFCYARHYLGTTLLAPFAALHYVLAGERNGHIPNPFFDPTYFSAQSGTPSFLRYLCDRDLWDKAPSRWFGTPRIDRRTSAPLCNPLVSFWLKGLGQSGRPTPVLDPAFVRNALCRDRVLKRWMLFRLAARPARSLPTNEGDLCTMQITYREAIDYQVLRASRERGNKDLVFIQAGSTVRFDDIGAPRDFDILLNFYDRPNALAETVDIAIRQPGTKTTAVATILRRDPELLLRYRSVLFLDDDIDIDRRQISRLFDIVHAEGLDLAQASLTAQSSCYFRCLKQPRAGRGIRRMNGVEIMMPIVSQRALREFGWTFSEGVSGWGVDLLLSAKVRERFGDTIGLIGEVVVGHERPTDTETGSLYVSLRDNGIDANAEAGDIVKRHKIPAFQQRIRTAPVGTA